MSMGLKYGDSAAFEPLHYSWCGLDDVYLLSGYERTPADGGDDIGIHDMDGLHRAIGESLARYKKELTGKELRFLRQQMELTQNELGDLMGTTDQTVARWEKGETEISGPADTLIRVLYFAQLHEEINLQKVLRGLRDYDAPVHDRLVFRETEAGWKAAA